MLQSQLSVLVVCPGKQVVIIPFLGYSVQELAECDFG